MRIFYLSDSVVPSTSANSIQVMKMCHAFAKNGASVRLYARHSSLDHEDDYAYYGIEPNFEIDKSTWYTIPTLGGIWYGIQLRRKVLAHARPDVLYGRDLYSLSWLVSAQYPFYYESHVPPPNRLRKYLEQRILQSPYLQKLIVITDALKQEYLRIFPQLSPDRIQVAHDGADLPAAIQKVQQLPGRDRVIKIGYVGQLFAGKGIDIIVKVAAKLPELDFHIIGGKPEDIANWKSEANLSNLYFHGHIPHGNLQGYFEAFDIMLLPNQEKVKIGGYRDIGPWTSPLKLFEYMSYKKAIVASDLPVLREVLQHEVNSLLCTPAVVDEWKQAVLRLADDAALRERLGSTAYQQFVARYTWQQRAEVVLA